MNSSATSHHSASLTQAGFGRRVAALLYDGLIVIALEMLAAGVVVATLEALLAFGVIHYAGYQDVSDMLTHHPVWSPVYVAYLALVWIGFFTFFWVRAGQTLGMRAWKLEVQNLQGGRITVSQALIRLATSGFGLANLAALLDPKKRGVHDMWAKTQVVVLSQPR
ncbi:RDD family protein [Vibrio sp. SM6]|uniref:RDD family protein n=1 Tax=Vibrio agarilyticus TaxID=2726741 RepID=A0A7X8YH04_9VIBR|nr:RDD family protein [Vibrio agarilyticus]NLS13598.1 RDD family protein [Vibrio agarilyticus]